MTDLSVAPTREAIDKLQAAMSAMPQEASLRTSHYFADGMYCRELWRPAGCLIVGKVHKKEHFYIVACGEVTVTGEGKPPERISGPRVIVSAPGTKRAVLAHTDATCITVHRTQSTDLNVIESELVESDDSALFDSHNHMKVLP